VKGEKNRRKKGGRKEKKKMQRVGDRQPLQILIQ
jgi:hypothetical protein